MGDAVLQTFKKEGPLAFWAGFSANFARLVGCSAAQRSMAQRALVRAAVLCALPGRRRPLVRNHLHWGTHRIAATCGRCLGCNSGHCPAAKAIVPACSRPCRAPGMVGRPLHLWQQCRCCRCGCCRRCCRHCCCAGCSARLQPSIQCMQLPCAAQPKAAAPVLASPINTPFSNVPLIPPPGCSGDVPDAGGGQEAHGRCPGQALTRCWRPSHGLSRCGVHIQALTRSWRPTQALTCSWRPIQALLHSCSTSIRAHGCTWGPIPGLLPHAPTATATPGARSFHFSALPGPHSSSRTQLQHSAPPLPPPAAPALARAPSWLILLADCVLRPATRTRWMHVGCEFHAHAFGAGSLRAMNNASRAGARLEDCSLFHALPIQCPAH